MRRKAFVIGVAASLLPVPAAAMPNAFWIFGFDVPGRDRPNLRAIKVPTPLASADSLDGTAKQSDPISTALPDSRPQIGAVP